MKSKAPSEHEDGLLEYLEDIIGTSHYKTEIDDAFKLLEKHSEDRVQKLNRLKFVEREKENLLQDKREAENYLRLKNEFVRAQSRYWQWILYKCFQAETRYQADQVWSPSISVERCSFVHFRPSYKRS
jgi:structural maintenance of chromosome 4